MKICHITHWFYPIKAGLENYVLNLSKYQIENGHEVHVITSTHDKFPKEEIVDRIHIHRYDNYNNRLGWFLLRGYYKNTFPSFLKTLYVCRREKIDLIHAHDVFGGITAYLTNKFLKIPYIYSEYGSIIWSRKWFNIPILKNVCRNANSIVVVRHDILQYFRDLKTELDKINFVTTGINTKEFRFSHEIRKKMREKNIINNDTIIVLFLGRLIPYKGVDLLIESVPLIMKNLPNVLVIVVGEGQLRDYLHKRVRELDVDKHVLFTGETSNPLDFFCMADIYVYPSPVEVFSSLSLLEALSVGIPSIITKSPDTEKNFKDGEDVLLLEKPIRSESIAERVIELALDKKLRAKLSANSRRLVETKFDEKKMFKKTMHIYEKVYQNRK